MRFSRVERVDDPNDSCRRIITATRASLAFKVGGLMAKRRRKRSSKSPKLRSVPAAAKPAFTELEEEFFRAGESVEHLETVAANDDAEDERPGLWRRLWSRAPLAA
jgi:hypothetical protein